MSLANSHTEKCLATIRILAARVEHGEKAYNVTACVVMCLSTPSIDRPIIRPATSTELVSVLYVNGHFCTCAFDCPTLFLDHIEINISWKLQLPVICLLKFPG